MDMLSRKSVATADMVGRAAVFLCAWLLVAAGGAAGQESHRLTSPDGKNVVTVTAADGALVYSVDREGRKLILPSRLGFEFRGAPPLGSAVAITGVSRESVDEAWEQPWGEVRYVRDHHEELRVSAEETADPGRRFDVVFRAFDDGVAFRYELPEQPNLVEFEIMDERTEFQFAGDPKAWWIPARDPTHRYELLYRQSPLSTLPEVHTPLTLVTLEGLHVVIHEANLVDYAGMNLTASMGRRLSVTLPAWADGVKVRGVTPFVTPWRTIQIAESASDLQPSLLGLNLNPPRVLEDVSWVEPMKYVGIWWSLHIKKETWGSGASHGATTENTRRYIDFAADNGFGGVLVEGWNLGWDGDWMANADLFSFTEPYPDYDLESLAAYANARGVTLIGHNETSMGVENYERQIEEAFALYERLGIHALKTGYVGDETAEGHAHH
ncbi:MAG: glycoside hydrolase family 97 N-terminal domain-containing protein, partial [Gemmatimonadota bacterium]